MPDKYEKDLAADVMHQMKQLEELLVEQWKKSSRLENQLSEAQDRIGGAERKARLLDEENVMIKSELKFWNDVYAQDTGVSHAVSEPVSVSVSSPPLTMPMPVPPASYCNASYRGTICNDKQSVCMSFGDVAITPTFSSPLDVDNQVLHNLHHL